MSPFIDPWILDGLGILLIAVGSAGLMALVIATPMRPRLKRSVGAICAAMAIGGVLLMVRAETLRGADRNLDPAQQADVAAAMGRFPGIRFEVFAAWPDDETRSLASKLAETIKMATGTLPTVETAPPSPQKGVVLVLRDRDADLGRAVAGTISRALMAARVAVITDDEAALDDRTVRIMVGEKP